MLAKNHHKIITLSQLISIFSGISSVQISLMEVVQSRIKNSTNLAAYVGPIITYQLSNNLQHSEIFGGLNLYFTFLLHDNT